MLNSMRQFKIIAHIDCDGLQSTREVKGFYYQKDDIVLVGDEVKENTIRQKFKNSEVKIEIKNYDDDTHRG